MSAQQDLDEAVSALQKILRGEREQLATGTFDHLAPLTEAKRTLCDTLEKLLLAPGAVSALPAYRRRLSSLAEMAKENEVLLRAARAGTASARSRINEIINRERMVGVYAENGVKVLSADAAVTREKSA